MATDYYLPFMDVTKEPLRIFLSVFLRWSSLPVVDDHEDYILGFMIMCEVLSLSFKF